MAKFVSHGSVLRVRVMSVGMVRGSARTVDPSSGRQAAVGGVVEVSNCACLASARPDHVPGLSAPRWCLQKVERVAAWPGWPAFDVGRCPDRAFLDECPAAKRRLFNATAPTANTSIQYSQVSQCSGPSPCVPLHFLPSNPVTRRNVWTLFSRSSPFDLLFQAHPLSSEL